DKGAASVAGILAHEYAHVMQSTYGVDLVGRERELHADFMAGWYMANKSRLVSTRVAGVAKALYDLGDAEGYWSEGGHGSPEDRVAAMKAGFRAGPLYVLDASAAGVEYVESH